MKAERVVAAVLGFVGACSLGIFAWAVHRAVFERGLNPGDVAMSVLALFGALCLVLAWQLVRAAPAAVPSGTAEGEARQTNRVSISRVCAAIGVALMMLAMLLPESWHPVAFLFVGLAFLVVSHVLTPCVERLEQLKKARESMRQL
jgi:hypothetical protein